MNDVADPVTAARMERDAALSTVTSSYARLRGELAEKSIGRRVAEDVANKAKASAAEVVEIAVENKGVVAGTVGALAIWFARKPLAEHAVKAWESLPGAWHLLKARIAKFRSITLE
ncbi:MAG: hypothetical protein ABIW31_02575 [Novosphingobium sp.]